MHKQTIYIKNINTVINQQFNSRLSPSVGKLVPNYAAKRQEFARLALTNGVKCGREGSE